MKAHGFRLVTVLLALMNGASAQPVPSAMAIGAAGFTESFEGFAIGANPAPWKGSAWPQTDATLTIVSNPSQSGARAAQLLLTSRNGSAPQGSVSVGFPVQAYRRKLMMVRFALRVEDGAPESATAQAFLRADATSYLPAMLARTAPQKPSGSGWRHYSITARIPANAVHGAFGILLAGASKAWIDDVTLEEVTPAQAGFEPPRQLSERGLSNLAAFTRLLGYVRFFHPSDQSASADWDAFAIAGVSRVEGARDDGELAAILRELFEPLAPTLQVSSGRPAITGSPRPCGRCLRWTHKGVGLGMPGPFYKSERVPAQAAAPYIAGLGGDLWAQIPLTVDTNPLGTLPQGKAPALRMDKPALFMPSGNDRATRLAGIALAWPVFQHFYPYFDVTKTDWEGALRRALVKAASDNDDAEFEVTLKQLVAALRDGHGAVLHSTRVAPPLNWRLVEGRLVITGIGFETASFRVGDIVRKINGQPVDELRSAIQSEISAASPQWAQEMTLNQLKRFRNGEPLTLEIERADGSIISVTPPIIGRPIAPPLAARTELRPGIWYFDLSRATAGDLQSAMNSLAAARAIIFDMRGYPSFNFALLLPHLADRDLRSDNMLTPITTLPDRSGETPYSNGQWRLPPVKPVFRGKFVFLTGASAISAAETFMGIVDGEKLGPIVGEPTAGTNGNVNTISLPGDYSISWTGMRITRRDGSPLHGVGIVPDHLVSPTLAGIRAGRDEVLERAIEIAQQGRAP